MSGFNGPNAGMEGYAFDGWNWKPIEGGKNPHLNKPVVGQSRDGDEQQRTKRRSYSRSRSRSRDRRRRSRSRDRRRRSRSRDRRRSRGRKQSHSRERRRRSPARDRRRERESRRDRDDKKHARKSPERSGRDEREPKEPKDSFEIKLCQDDEQGDAANSDYKCTPSTTMGDVKKHLAPLCADVPGFLGEADIIIHRGDDKKVFNAMTASDAGLAEGSVLKWYCVRRDLNEKPETDEEKAKRLDKLEQEFGGTADPCTDRGFWLGDDTNALKDAKPGDWFCQSCKCHNFAIKSKCNGCNMTKPAQ